MIVMNNDTQCPCGLPKVFEQCCGALINGMRPAITAEALMRSRYVAYVLKNKNYLLETWHPSTRPNDDDLFNDQVVWTGLEILSTKNGLAEDTKGEVAFRASCRVKNKPAGIDENSEFVRENDRWFYVDGSAIAPIRSSQNKIGRNELCTCGSGKKYKRCCG